jgi:adenosyl cobinamide kinase/adenosyl cobinamide phosphate guanylyltransferase
MLTFLVGGARSGKSALALEIALRHYGPVVFVATAEPFDDDLRDRIARHRHERPTEWPTIEEPVALAAALSVLDTGALVVVDCLTVWVGNLFHHLPDADAREQQYAALLRVLGGRDGHTVVVSNEVGLGLVPDQPSSREYRDELGRLNQRVAAIAERSLFLVAGRAVELRDPWEVLP